jgi:hypothetical protein
MRKVTFKEIMDFADAVVVAGVVRVGIRLEKFVKRVRSLAHE